MEILATLTLDNGTTMVAKAGAVDDFAIYLVEEGGDPNSENLAKASRYEPKAVAFRTLVEETTGRWYRF